MALTKSYALQTSTLEETRNSIDKSDTAHNIYFDFQKDILLLRQKQQTTWTLAGSHHEGPERC